MTDRFDDAEPTHAASATAHLLDELQLHGYRPFADEPDPQPLPDPDHLSGAVADICDALVATLGETRLEPDLLWSLVNLFHRGIDRIGRELDTYEASQQRSQRAQDGSEVRSVELERLLALGLGRTLIERRNAFEFLRDAAAEPFEHHTGSAWRPRAGSMVSRRTMAAAMIGSRDFLTARRRAETEPLLPPGVRIAFAGGVECNDHQCIWAALDCVDDCSAGVGCGIVASGICRALHGDGGMRSDRVSLPPPPRRMAFAKDALCRDGMSLERLAAEIGYQIGQRLQRGVPPTRRLCTRRVRALIAHIGR